MTNRTPFFACLLLACSNGSSPNDAGTSDVVTQDVTSSDVATDTSNDAPPLGVPQALDQAGKLALWLEATPSDLGLGDGGAVATWKDKSKNKNDATAAGAPTVLAGAIVGHDAVHFADYTDFFTIADAASLRFGTDQVYIVGVARILTLRSMLFSKAATPDGGSGQIGLEVWSHPGASTDAGLQPTPFAWLDTGADQILWGNDSPIADAKYHAIAFRRLDATHLAIWADALTPRTATVAAIDISVAGQPVRIGPNGGPTPPDFALAEELVLHDGSGTVSDADVASVQSYLTQKYGL
jgi:hypothetical protein